MKSLPGLEPFSAGTIFCIGRNYAAHARELNNEVPSDPVVFLKPASSIIYDGDSIILPSQSSNIHHEVELVCVIGMEGKTIPVDNALQYVAGYAVGIDVTARDIQQKAKEKRQPWSVAKGFDTFAPLGNFVPAETVPDPGKLELTLQVNGKTRQQDRTSLMIFPVAKLISYLSTIFTLSPGDLIFTGTPAGVSPLQPGDEITARMNDDTSTLTVGVTAE